MKAVLLVTLIACIAGALGARYPQSTEQAKAIIKNGGPVIRQLLPAFNHTTELEPNVTISSDRIRNLKGTLTVLNGIIYGLDTLSDNLALNLLTLSAEGTVTVSSIRVTAGFSLDGTILLNSGSHKLSGSGNVDLTINGVVAPVYVKVRLTLLLKVQVSEIRLDPSVVSCEGSADGALSDGEQINVTEICSNIGATVKDEWTQQGPAVLADVITIVNEVLKEMTLQELIDLIGSLRP